MWFNTTYCIQTQCCFFTLYIILYFFVFVMICDMYMKSHKYIKPYIVFSRICTQPNDFLYLILIVDVLVIVYDYVLITVIYSCLCAIKSTGNLLLCHLAHWWMKCNWWMQCWYVQCITWISQLYHSLYHPDALEKVNKVI